MLGQDVVSDILSALEINTCLFYLILDLLGIHLQGLAMLSFFLERDLFFVARNLILGYEIFQYGES
jgi:hypothetical protein